MKTPVGSGIVRIYLLAACLTETLGPKCRHGFRFLCPIRGEFFHDKWKRQAHAGFLLEKMRSSRSPLERSYAAQILTG
jgi:hypothetical protein